MKIGILGTAPQLVDAPFNDKTWRLWAVPGCYSVDKPERNQTLERVYEFHPPETMAITCEPRNGFIEFAQSLGSRFILLKPNDRYPVASIFYYQNYLDIHGKSPFSCSVSWMMAEAIEEILNSGDEEKEIGIWGINMAHDSEYVYQKPGVRDMIGYARAKGIKITVPETSELMALHSLYGVEEVNPAFKIIKFRTKELTEKKKQYELDEQTSVQSINFFNGALAEYEFLGTNPTPEQISVRKESLKATVEHHKTKREDAIKHCNIFHGALEEHIWVEQNFFKHAG